MNATPLSQEGHLQRRGNCAGLRIGSSPISKPEKSLRKHPTVLMSAGMLHSLQLWSKILQEMCGEQKIQQLEIPRETPENTLEVQESGEYRCQAQDSSPSSPVCLVFSSASLILQAPLSVFEGDSVVLRCRAKAEVTLNTIYKDDNVLAFLNENSDFQIHQASLKDNGEYRCTGHKESCCLVSSNTVKIQVQELFSRPVLRASSSQPISGSPVTLTCETQLSLERSDAQLQFCFFRNGQTLGSGWSRSPNFQIAAMWREDSGFYWCKAAAVTHSIISDSLRSWIQVQRKTVNGKYIPEANASQGRNEQEWERTQNN
ncbi:Fc receptor-like protein 5 [Saguinus oedipus]|uniref:Fc receptor-like protein 5 n=1 Tax=Saguinus oedipus TaxID=9490 RepID=A0ABQ9TIA1_SAGOE|nr:Fc receptor-like protein 5 [Saguinus oedipus]